MSDDDDDWLKDQPKQEEVKESKRTSTSSKLPENQPKQARRGRQSQNQQIKSNKNEEQFLQPNNQANISWIKANEDDEEDNWHFQPRGQKIQTSFIVNNLPKLSNDEEEISPDSQNTSWALSDDPKKKEVKQVEVPKRGNRQTPSTPQESHFKKQNTPYYVEKEHQSSNNNYRNEYNRDNRDNYQRGRGRGRGRGGFRNNYQTNEHRQQKNWGGYRQRNERNQYQNKRDNRDQPYNNDNRNNNYRGYQNNQEPKQSTQTNNQPKRGNRGNRQYRQNNYQPNNYRSYEQKQQPKQESKIQIIEKQKEKVKEQFVVPKGRKCWPESSMYILGCKFCITYRPIHQFRCKLLVIPYSTIKMEYYPGNIINASEVDYKKRILSKGDDISKAGSVYMQKALQVGTFVGLAFLKIDENRLEDSLRIGVKQVLKLIEKVEGEITLESIIFPICQKLGSPHTVICTFLQNLQKCRKIKQVYITTNQPQCFVDAMNIFVQQVQKLLNQNEILIN